MGSVHRRSKIGYPVARVRWPLLIVGVALVGVGCSRHADVGLSLAVGEGVRSLFLGVEVGNEVEVRAIDLTNGQVELPVLDAYIGRYAVTLTAIEHVSDLETLRLTPGIIASVEDGTPLPAATGRIMGTTVRGEDVEPWAELSALGPALADFRFDGPRRSECLDRGGCFDADGEDPKACIVPCPAPTAPPDAPAEPEAPRNVCPTGWTTADLGDGVAVCTPFPSGPDDCPNLLAHFPGEASCRSPGRSCPAGEWPEGLTGDVVYVRPGATGGDGTMGAPYGTLSAATSAASAGSTIALSKGTHAGTIALPDGVALVGACVEQTQIDGSGSTLSTVRVTTGRRVEIRDVFIRARGDGIRVQGAGAYARIDGVAILDGTGSAAINVDTAGEVVGSDIYIGPSETHGIRLDDDAIGTFDRVVIDRVSRLALSAFGRAEGTVRDLSIVDVQPDADDGRFGRAFDVESGGTLELERVYTLRARNISGYVSGVGSRLSIVDGVVSDTLPRASDDASGDAFHIVNGGTFEATRTWIDRSRSDHLWISGGNDLLTTTATLSDVVFTSAMRQDSGGDGYAIRAVKGAQVHLTRGVVDKTYFTAVFLEDPETLFKIRDTRFTNIGSLRDSGSVTTLRAEKGAKIDAAAVAFIDVPGKAIHVEDSGAFARVHDITVQGAGSETCLVCAGLCAHHGGRITGARILVERAHGRGINASDGGSTVDIEHVVVRTSLPAPTCTTSVRSPLLGDGVGEIDGGRVDLRNFVLEMNPSAGVVVENYIGELYEGEGVYASDGVVKDNTIGANLFLAGFPIENVANRVLYEDNATNLNN